MGIMFSLLILLSLFAGNIHSYRVKSEKEALEYLTHYGYVDPKEMPQDFTLKDCNKKLQEFQKLARVDVTGLLDKSTMKAMNMPRCGCPDFIQLSFKNKDKPFYGNRTTYHKFYFPYHRHHHHHHNENETILSPRNPFQRESSRRTKRYVLTDSRWDKAVITYNIAKYPSRRDLQISTRDIDNAMQKAFSIWEQHTNLRFIKSSTDVDIEISFASTYHGDSYPFDGPGKTLAHAFFPGSGIGGDVHFEEDEDWRLNTYSGVDLKYVAVHEIGHSLGLGHSSDYGSIMYPIYRGYIPNLQLHDDDIRGIQALYGSRAPPTRVTTTTTPKSTRTTTYRTPVSFTTLKTPRPTPKFDDNDLCNDPYVDGATVIYNDALLVFQGTRVFEIGKNGEGVLPGWPKEISSYFPGLTGKLDCVLTRSNGKTYFFKGERYWRYTGRQMDRGYPRSISEYFPGIPNNLDAAFEWDDEFVFVKGNDFWRFNSRKRPQVQSFFPMPVSHWGLSGRINAAFTTPNSTIYLFQGPTYWHLNKNTHKIKAHYGKTSITESWFGCSEP